MWNWRTLIAHNKFGREFKNWSSFRYNWPGFDVSTSIRPIVSHFITVYRLFADCTHRNKHSKRRLLMIISGRSVHASTPNNPFIENYSNGYPCVYAIFMNMDVHSSIFNRMDFLAWILLWTLHGYFNPGLRGMQYFYREFHPTRQSEGTEMFHHRAADAAGAPRRRGVVLHLTTGSVCFRKLTFPFHLLSTNSDVNSFFQEILIM